MKVVFTVLFALIVSSHALVIPHKENAIERISADIGQCPGGPSLPIQCDPFRPWPQCPPQSYCYDTGAASYFCCPVWSGFDKMIKN